jgi:hypothetical protein
MWIWPNTAQTAHEGIFTIRSASPGQTNGLSTGVGGTGQLNYNWDNNAAATTGFVTGLVIDTNNVWSMAALVVTATNSTLYLGSTATGMQSATQVINNIVETGGPGVPIYIGTDPNNGNNSDSFGGAISSVVMFSNALSPAQIATLFDAGTSLGLNPPYLVSLPPFSEEDAEAQTAEWQGSPGSVTNASYMLVPGGSVTIPASAYVGPSGGAYWMSNNGTGFGKVTNPRAGGAVSLAASNPNSLNLSCSLTISNIQASDAGTYYVVITNAGGTTTSSNVTIALLPAPPANSFEAVAIGYGAVAYWPLNETNNPQASYYAAAYDHAQYPDVINSDAGFGTFDQSILEAYDVVGGWNGIYGYNASTAATAATGSVTGPQPPNFLGFPANNGGLEMIPTTPSNNWVATAGSPTIPPGCTNMTLIAWVYPTATLESNSAGIVVMRSGGQLGGLCYSATYGGGTWLDDYWNGGNYNNYTLVDPPSNTWSMVAMVVAPTSVTLYICNTNGIGQYVQGDITNAYQSWGQAITIGGDPSSGNSQSNNFNGSIGPVAMFTNALTLNQISLLYDAGLDLDAGPPTIITQPSSTASYESRTAVFSVQASGSTALSYAWQVWNGTKWIYLADGYSPVYGTITGSLSNILTIVAPSLPGNVPSKPFTYQVVVTDEGGSTTITTPVTLTVGNSAGYLSVYAQAVTNLNPVAYWELNETAGPIAYDYWGGFLGTYQSNVSVGLGTQTTPLGPGAPGDPSWIWPCMLVPPFNDNLESSQDPYPTAPEFTNAYVVGANWGGNLTASNDCLTSSYLSIPPLNINSNAMTAILWIYPNENQTYSNGLFYCRGSGTIAGFGYADNTNGTLGYNWANVAYTWNSGLTPQPTNWNMLAYVITPSNATVYCYNTNTQGQAINSVSNSIEAWGEPAELGNDPYTGSAPGNRQFDGSIAEVAVFNQSLTSTAINNLFYVATGIAAPPVFRTQPSGGNGVYTAVVANGPNLGVVWQGPGISMPTNGTYSFSFYAGTTFTVLSTGTDPITTTLTISNVGPVMGDTFDVMATNSLVPGAVYAYVTVPTTSTSTNASWTANFNAIGSANAGGYSGPDLVGSGTFWNPIETTSALPYTNVSSWDDTHTINTGVSIAVYADYASPDYASASGSALFNTYIYMSTTNSIVITTTPGYYNLYFYAENGNAGSRSAKFTLNGISQETTTETTTGDAPAPITTFILDTNYVVFTNVFITNGTLTVTTGTGGGQTGTIPFNGVTLQLIGSQTTNTMPLTLTMSGTNAILTYLNATLESSTSVLGPWTPVLGAPAPVFNVTNTYQVPGLSIPSGQPSAARYYISVPTQ